MKVLIAEDDVTSHAALKGALEKWGYEVVSTCDGNEAWAALQAEDTPRLAILDWMMPKLTGVEVCRKARARQGTDDRYLYVILLTSKASKEDIIEGIEAGADDYVVKPFDHSELRVRLRAGQRIIQLESELVAAKNAFRTQAMYDELTGALNRRAAMEHLAAELSRACREKSRLGVAMLDLDHFKEVNDTCGHQAGDAVLRETAVRIRSVLREYDSVGRYGGEEFLVITPGLGQEEGKGVFERIRRAIAGRQMQTAIEKVHVTASLGVVICTGSSSTADDLIHAADVALYHAKDSGRNCVVYSDSMKGSPAK